MKKILGIILAILFLATPVSAEISTLIDAQLLRYEPVPAQPGDTLDVFVQLTNNGNQAERGISIALQDSEDFTVIGDETVNVGTLSARTSYVASYRVRVSADSQPGDNELTYQLQQTGQTPQTNTLEIQIREENQQVYVSNIEFSEAQLRPGQDSTLTLGITNAADRTVRDVRVQLGLDDVPLAPLGSTSRKQIDSIAARSESTITYNLAVEPTATANLYTIPVTINFIDLNGEEQSIEEDIGVRVLGETRTQAYVDDVSWQGDNLEVALRIVNVGLSELKFVNVELSDSEGYTIPRQEQVAYVGNIDSDDWETVRFNVETSAETIEIPLVYTYQDAFNNQQEISETFTVDVPEKPNQGGVPLVVWVVVVLVIVAGIWWYRKKSKKKKR